MKTIMNAVMAMTIVALMTSDVGAYTHTIMTDQLIASGYGSESILDLRGDWEVIDSVRLMGRVTHNSAFGEADDGSIHVIPCDISVYIREELKSGTFAFMLNSEIVVSMLYSTYHVIGWEPLSPASMHVETLTVEITGSVPNEQTSMSAIKSLFR